MEKNLFLILNAKSNCTFLIRKNAFGLYQTFLIESPCGKFFWRLVYMRIVRNRTKEIVNEVPIEKINWRLTENSMSIIEIIHHIASVEKAVWGSSLRNKKTGTVDSFLGSMQTQDVINYMDTVRKDSEAYWSSLNSNDLEEKIATPTGDLVKLKNWLLLAPEHEIHHRSFIHAYRKIWGMSSHPIYGLTFEQLKSLNS